MAFLRLIRIGNLLIIAYTLLGVLYSQGIQKLDLHSKIDFLILVIFTVLVAAAGNAINDYFDIRSDKVNKPEKMVLEKLIKKRWAIIIHWGFNLVALLLSCYLSFRYATWFYLFIHLFASVLLWYYSTFLKKILFWSNLSISVLVAIVPLMGLKLAHDLQLPLYKGSALFIFSCICFLLNTSREIIKDIQDVEGDKLKTVKSIPIVFGHEKARWIALGLIFLCTPIYLIGLFLGSYPMTLGFNLSFTISIMIGLITLLFIVMGYSEKTLNLLLKLSLIAGATSIYFL